MFKVRKGNRILTVNETEKEFYLSEGYEVVEFDEGLNDYVVTEKATGGRTYSVAEYNKVVEELEKVKGELAELTNGAVDPEKPKVKKESKGDSK